MNMSVFKSAFSISFLFAFSTVYSQAYAYNSVGYDLESAAFDHKALTNRAGCQLPVSVALSASSGLLLVPGLHCLPRHHQNSAPEPLTAMLSKKSVRFLPVSREGSPSASASDHDPGRSASAGRDSGGKASGNGDDRPPPQPKNTKEPETTPLIDEDLDLFESLAQYLLGSANFSEALGEIASFIDAQVPSLTHPFINAINGLIGQVAGSSDGQGASDFLQSLEISDFQTLSQPDNIYQFLGATFSHVKKDWAIPAIQEYFANTLFRHIDWKRRRYCYTKVSLPVTVDSVPPSSTRQYKCYPPPDPAPDDIPPGLVKALFVLTEMDQRNRMPVEQHDYSVWHMMQGLGAIIESDTYRDLCQWFRFYVERPYDIIAIRNFLASYIVNEEAFGILIFALRVAVTPSQEQFSQCQFLLQLPQADNQSTSLLWVIKEVLARYGIEVLVAATMSTLGEDYSKQLLQEIITENKDSPDQP